MKRLTRFLFFAHRWFGVVMGLFFAMWFFSGVVMAYVGFPRLSAEEHFAGLPALATPQVRIGPKAALQRLDIEALAGLEALKLTTVLGRPAWLVESAASPPRAVFADNGEPLGPITADEAAEAAERFYANAAGAAAATVGVRALELDQWTVSSGLNPHRPLYKVALDDSEGTTLYVSSKTGQVVRDTRRAERAWNWAGANLHWIYPVQLRRHAALWADVVTAIASLALVSVVTGVIVGLMRFRPRRRYGGRRRTPYRGIARYHHVIGLVAAVFLSTYVFSGLMSMNPFGVFNDGAQDPQALQRYRYGDRAGDLAALDFSGGETPPATAKEISWHFLDGRAFRVVHHSASKRDIPGAGPPPLNERHTPALRSAVTRLMPDQPLESLEVLGGYDTYYYSHHGRRRPLPVLRAQFADPADTLYYIDALTGEPLSRLTRAGRAKRWLYHGLHSWDFNFLIQNRPAWDIWVIVLCAVGLAFSLTSLVLAGRVLARRRA